VMRGGVGRRGKPGIGSGVRSGLVGGTLATVPMTGSVTVSYRLGAKGHLESARTTRGHRFPASHEK
jgi:hypothetical protein